MSFSLSISGHIDDPAVAEEVDGIVKAAGADLVERLGAFAVSGLSASFSGPTGGANLVPPAPDPDEVEPEGA